MTLRTWSTIVVSTLLTSFLFNANAMAKNEEGEDNLLTIGSVAPALDIEHWVQDGEGKFQPVTEFKPGNIYIVEFWATWCGPCIRSMPHLSKLQREYADKNVTLISVSDEDLETVNGFLEKEADAEEGKTYADITKHYCLTTDPDGIGSGVLHESSSAKRNPNGLYCRKRRLD